VFIAVDHCSGEFIGTHASSSASRWEALEPVRQGVTRHFGGVGPDVAKGLTLRHDHGSNYMVDDFRREIGCFGILSSPAFVWQPEGNGVAERAIRTLSSTLYVMRRSIMPLPCARCGRAGFFGVFGLAASVEKCLRARGQGGWRRSRRRR